MLRILSISAAFRFIKALEFIACKRSLYKARVTESLGHSVVTNHDLDTFASLGHVLRDPFIVL